MAEMHICEDGFTLFLLPSRSVIVGTGAGKA